MHHVIGNESMPKIIINDDTTNLFLKKCNQHFANFKTLTVSECCVIKLLPYFYLKIYLYFSIGNGQPREPAFYRHTVVPCMYIGWNDVTESIVKIRSPFCGYNMT